MTSATMDLIATDALESVNGVKLVAPSNKRTRLIFTVFLSWLSFIACGYLRRKAKDFVAHSNQMRLYLFSIQNDEDGFPLIDSEGILKGKLEAIKQSLKDLNNSIDRLSVMGGEFHPKLEAEAKRFIEIINEFYGVVNNLQSALIDHDLKLEEGRQLLKRLDISRMKSVLAQETILMPEGLSRQEKRTFILTYAQKNLK